MYPGIHTESETFVGYIDEMLQGVRNAAHGLTDAQAHETPTRSTLSIAGIVKHCTWVMHQTTGQPTTPDAEGAVDFAGSFVAGEDESLESLVAAFDDARGPYLEAIAAMDPDETIVVGPKPWEGILEEHQASLRLLLAHHIDEFARHAGHADIIREQLDGAQALPLRMAVEGMPDNAFVQAWRPDEGATA